MTTLLILYIAAGLLLVALSIPLLLGKIRPNPVYGFRVPATLNDPDLWYAVNKFAAKRLVAAGLGILAPAIGLYFLPGLTVEAYALLCLAVFVLVFGAGLWQSIRYMRSLDGRSDPK